MAHSTIRRDLAFLITVFLLACQHSSAEKILFFLAPLPVPCSPHLAMLRVINEMAARGHDVKVRHDK